MRLARQEVADMMIGRTVRADANAVENMRAREAQGAIEANREALVASLPTSRRDAMTQRDLAQMIAVIATRLEATVIAIATLTAVAVVVVEVTTTTSENANLVNLVVESETVDMVIADVLIVLGMNLAVALLELMSRHRDVERLSGMVMDLDLLLRRRHHHPLLMVIREVVEVEIGRMTEIGETVEEGIESETEVVEKAMGLTARGDAVLDLKKRCMMDNFSSILFMLFVRYLGFERRGASFVFLCLGGFSYHHSSLITRLNGYLHCSGVLTLSLSNGTGARFTRC